MDTRRMLSAWMMCSLLLVLLSIPPTQAQAIVKLGPQVAIDLGDIGDAPGRSWAVGADARVRSEDVPLQANGAFDYYPLDEDRTIYTFDLNGVFLLINEGRSYTPYAGLGLGVTRVSSDIDIGDETLSEDETETGMNFVGGAEFNLGAFTPFAEAQFTNGQDMDRFSISGGLLINF